MYNRSILIILLLVLTPIILAAQQLEFQKGQVILKLKEQYDANDFIAGINEAKSFKSKLNLKECLVDDLNIWLLEFDFSRLNEEQVVDVLFRKKEVEMAQLNGFIKLRAEPNDPRFGQQWQYINNGGLGGTVDADLDADLAWDITTGGLTPQGDTIVVAVLDDGINMDHEDLRDNLWRNHAEIPDNGIDDDNNGYIDDYFGFNSNDNNDIDNITGGGHGGPVAGIVGAKGNNGIGVAGVNWDVKLMIIRNNFNTDEANVLKAFGYALTQRRIYNETNGASGAFVVSTNGSWGRDFGDPEDSPLWCSFYDDLGAEGILNCGATINGDTDVDREGDLPTACTSEFLISVTNMNSAGVKVTQAGFGAISIDLGAFGAGTFTTSRNNYGAFGGTSGATPHVAGTIALLYSVPCPNLGSIALSDPGAAALLARRYILEGVKPNESLEGITVTEGVLNMANSVNLVLEECEDCNIPVNIRAENLTDAQADINWFILPSALSVNLQWRKVGDQIWNTVFNVTAPYELSGLDACDTYELQLESICDGESSGFSESMIIETDGCCEAPQEILEVVASDNEIALTWESVLAAEHYDLRIREIGAPDWEVISGIESTSYNFTGLAACTEFEIQIRSFCLSINTSWTSSIETRTQGCGACLDSEYCDSVGEDPSSEWIESITINGIENVSGLNEGYAEFTDLDITLARSGLYEFIFTPGFGTGGTFPEYFRMWLDIDQNGSFEDSEMIFDAGEPTETPISANVIIPEEAVIGLSRLRVIMKWTGFAGGDTPPEVCAESYNFGETEDYCVNIVEPGIGCENAPMNLDTLSIFQNSAVVGWDEVEDAVLYQLQWRSVIDLIWESAFVEDEEYFISDLDECTLYEFQVQSYCQNLGSGFDNRLNFRTQCNVNSTSLVDSPNISVAPNPFSKEIHFSGFETSEQVFVVSIYDIQGKLVYQTNGMELNSESLSIENLGHLESGLYYIKLESDSNTYVQKVTKI